MTVDVTPKQQALHDHTVDLCKKHGRVEWQIVQALQEIDRTRLYRKFGSPSLFQYALQMLGLPESVAYRFITVARKAAQVPALQDALARNQISVAKASPIVSAVNPKNAGHLIEVAATQSKRLVETEVAKINPKPAKREYARPISLDLIELKVALSSRAFAKLKRAQELLAQRRNEHVNLAGSLEIILTDYCQRHDPVEKAKRSQERTHELSPGRVVDRKIQKNGETQAMRQPLSASQRHQVNARDGGRCTFVDAKGNRCTNERWIQIHHIKPVSQGGGNDPENLTTLCYAHHDIVHQLCLPIDGQVTWLREPTAAYG